MRLLSLRSGLRDRVRRHPRVLAVGVCAVAGVGAYFAAQGYQARGHWRRAEAALRDNDFARAQTELAAYLDGRPDSAEAHFLLARACRRARVEDLDRARTHLTEAKRLSWPAAAVAVETRFLDYQEYGPPPAGDPAPAAGAGEDGRLALEALARGCLRAERLEEAVVWLDRWVEAYPDDWYGYLWRGHVFQHMDQPARAAGDFDEVARRAPSEDVDLRLGLALVQGGLDYPRAARVLEHYLHGHPDDVDARIAAARCRCVLNDPAAARAALTEVLAARPGHPDALNALALAEIDLEDYPEALRVLKQIEPVAGSPPVEEAFRRLLRLEPVADGRSAPTRVQTVWQLLAAVLRRLGRDREADDYAGRVERLSADVNELLKLSKENARVPNDVNRWYRMGELSLRVGMPDAGVAWLQRVLRAAPDDRRAHRTLADYYAGRPDPESRRQAAWHRRKAGDP